MKKRLSLAVAIDTYLGHRQVTATYWYFTAIPELMALSSRRFAAYAGESLLS